MQTSLSMEPLNKLIYFLFKFSESVKELNNLLIIVLLFIYPLFLHFKAKSKFLDFLTYPCMKIISNEY